MASTSIPILNLLPYGPLHGLQTLSLTIQSPFEESEKDRKLFVVYIHGGAWRDPRQSASTFRKAQELIQTAPAFDTIKKRIVGFASINYALSPHPQFPASPGAAADGSRSAVHPKHVQDCHRALLWLSANCEVGTEDGWDYLLVGHSCGATLAYQLALGIGQHGDSIFNGREPLGKPPIGVVGVEGIYDIPALIRRHIYQPAYRDFITGAFGDNERVWEDASPARGIERITKLRQDKKIKVCVVAHSHADELVEWEQVEDMRRALNQVESNDQEVVLEVVEGNHEEPWEKGFGVAKAIEAAITRIYKT